MILYIPDLDVEDCPVIRGQEEKLGVGKSRCIIIILEFYENYKCVGIAFFFFARAIDMFIISSHIYNNWII